MQKFFILLSVLMFTSPGYAQKDLAGEYYLEGVMETASGFKLNADSTFEFFFSYGALDRSGEGRWTMKDGNLVLNSRVRPPKDFALLESKPVPGKGITIKIVEKNTMLLRYVQCVIRAGRDSVMEVTNDDGLAKFDKQDLQSIELLFQLCPDRPSVFSINDKTHNFFEFRFEPWIAEVFFSDFILKPAGKELQGKHPLLDDKVYSYVKQDH